MEWNRVNDRQDLSGSWGIWTNTPRKEMKRVTTASSDDCDTNKRQRNALSMRDLRSRDGEGLSSEKSQVRPLVEPPFTKEVLAVMKKLSYSRYTTSDLVKAQQADHILRCIRLLYDGHRGKLPGATKLAVLVRSFFNDAKNLIIVKKNVLKKRRKIISRVVHAVIGAVGMVA